MENELSIKLKHYRRIRNFSQEGLAEASRISIRTIQRIEKGESIGSAYTLATLATALNIDASDLAAHHTAPQDARNPENITNKLRLLNLSVFSVILIPLTNIIIPTIIFLRHKDDDQVKRLGAKIISFQLLWTICTLGMMIIVPLVLLPFEGVQGSSIPLSVPVYFLSVALNIYLTTRITICLNHNKPFLTNVPNML